jgi:hypothetical protein
MTGATLLPLPYRRVSLQDAPVPLEPEALTDYLRGREAYRRTDYVVFRSGDDVAVVEVRRESDAPLFSPIVDIRILALPHECLWVEAPSVDTSNPSQMAQLAHERMSQGIRGVVVCGLHEHVNFILEPDPLVIRVLDVVPPDPPKLYVQAQQVLDFDEALPAITLVSDPLDLREIASSVTADSLVFPCRASGIQATATVDFLDQRPPDRHALLVGCERSAQFYRHYYGRDPERIDTCPRNRQLTGSLTLLKCCLLERGLEEGLTSVVVPWGATRAEVARGLARLVQKGGRRLLEDEAIATYPEVTETDRDE